MNPHYVSACRNIGSVSMTTMNWVKTVPGPMNVYFAAQWMTQTFLNLSWVGQTLSSNCPLIIINIERRLSLQSRKDRPMHFKTPLTGGFMWMNSVFFLIKFGSLGSCFLSNRCSNQATNKLSFWLAAWHINREGTIVRSEKTAFQRGVRQAAVGGGGGPSSYSSSMPPRFTLAQLTNQTNLEALWCQLKRRQHSRQGSDWR